MGCLPESIVIVRMGYDISLCHALHQLSCRESVQKTLRELGVQHLDLLLMHWPDAWVPGSDKQPDTEVTIEQTWCASPVSSLILP